MFFPFKRDLAKEMLMIVKNPGDGEDVSRFSLHREFSEKNDCLL